MKKVLCLLPVLLVSVATLPVHAIGALVPVQKSVIKTDGTKFGAIVAGKLATQLLSSANGCPSVFAGSYYVPNAGSYPLQSACDSNNDNNTLGASWAVISFPSCNLGYSYTIEFIGDAGFTETPLDNCQGSYRLDCDPAAGNNMVTFLVTQYDASGTATATQEYTLRFNQPY